jgi:hypothetical protein
VLAAPRRKIRSLFPKSAPFFGRTTRCVNLGLNASQAAGSAATTPATYHQGQRVLRRSMCALPCLALLNPDWSEHFVDVTGLDLRNGEFSERRVSVPFERRWPLITMLLAPRRPVFTNVGFGALFEGGHSDLALYGLRFLTRCPLLLDDVDAGCAAIPFHSEPRRITS